jgi:hypothetical protein
MKIPSLDACHFYGSANFIGLMAKCRAVNNDAGPPMRNRKTAMNTYERYFRKNVSATVVMLLSP